MFSPYHQFNNCKKLNRCVQQLYDSSCVPTAIHDIHHNYHGALEQKLKGAKYNLDELERLIGTCNITSISENLLDIMFRANLYIDGFFNNGGSALDILAHEILTVFDIQPSGNVYYQDAHSKISSRYPSDPILNRLTIPSWKTEFSDYRNASTHEVLLCINMNLNIQLSSQGQMQSLKLPLADDPRATPSSRTFNRNPDALKYCVLSFKRLLSHINAIYGEIATRASAKGSLPLP